MKDKAIKIKQRKLSERCEICHQSDCFNPKTEECSRCAKLNLKSIDVDKAIKQYLFNRTFIWIAIVSMVLISTFVSSFFLSNLFFEAFAPFFIGLIFLSFGSFLYYQYRCRRLIWLVKNIQPMNVEIILEPKRDKLNFLLRYVVVKFNERFSIPLDIHEPPWDVNSIGNQPYPALAYFDPKGGTVLRLDKGFLMSLSTANFSSLKLPKINKSSVRRLKVKFSAVNTSKSTK